MSAPGGRHERCERVGLRRAGGRHALGQRPLVHAGGAGLWALLFSLAVHAAAGSWVLHAALLPEQRPPRLAVEPLVFQLSGATAPDRPAEDVTPAFEPPASRPLELPASPEPEPQLVWHPPTARQARASRTAPEPTLIEFSAPLSEVSSETPPEAPTELQRPVAPAEVAEAPTAPAEVLPALAEAPTAPAEVLPAPAEAAPTPAEAAPTQDTSVRPPEVAPGNRPPDYPAEARRARQQGTVVVLVQLDASGAVLGALVVSGSGWPLLDAAALDAVSGWHFGPALRGGQPCEGSLRVPIEFVLKG